MVLQFIKDSLRSICVPNTLIDSCSLDVLIIYDMYQDIFPESNSTQLSKDLVLSLGSLGYSYIKRIRVILEKIPKDTGISFKEIFLSFVTAFKTTINIDLTQSQSIQFFMEYLFAKYIIVNDDLMNSYISSGVEEYIGKLTNND